MASRTYESALRAFLRRAVPYEALAAPMDRGLRAAVLVSLGVVFLSALLLLAWHGRPGLAEELVGSRFFMPFMGVAVETLLEHLYRGHVLALALNEGALIWGLVLALASRGLSQATRRQNYLALVPVMVAAADLLALAVVAALLAFQLVVWILLVVAMLVLGILMVALFIVALFALASGIMAEGMRR